MASPQRVRGNEAKGSQTISLHTRSVWRPETVRYRRSWPEKKSGNQLLTSVPEAFAMDWKRRPIFFLEIPMVSATFGSKMTPMTSPKMAGTLGNQRFPGVPEAFYVSCMSCDAITKENIGKRSGNQNERSRERSRRGSLEYPIPITSIRTN